MIVMGTSSASTSLSNMSSSYTELSSEASVQTSKPCLVSYKENEDSAKRFIEIAETKLKRKPLNLKFKPRYKKAGDQYCKAAAELQKNQMTKEAVQLLEKAAYCFQMDRMWLRATKAMDFAFTITLDPTKSDCEEVFRLAIKTQAFYLKVNQIDEAASVLDRAANFHVDVIKKEEDIGHTTDDEVHIKKAIMLLQRGMELLDSEGRPAQAGMFGSKMLQHSLPLPNLTQGIMESAITCLKLLSSAGSGKLLGTSALLTIFLLIKHFENEALGEGLKILSEYGKEMTEEYADFIKHVLQALKDNDRKKVEELKNSTVLQKSSKNIQIEMLSLLQTIDLENEDTELDSAQVNSEKLTIGDPNTPLKVNTVGLTIAAGAALVTGAVAYNRRYVYGSNKKRGLYEDVTGYEHFHPSNIGMTEDHFREFRREDSLGYGEDLTLNDD